MQVGLLEALKTRFGFHEWERAGAGREQLFVRNFRISGQDLPYELMRSRTARLGTARRVNTSMWNAGAGASGMRSETPIAAAGATQPSGGPQVLVVVDAFEYDSVAQAKEALLELTSQFHQPVPLDVRMEEVGDVSLATRDGSWFAFTRGNLLVRVMSASGEPVATRPVAQSVDASLTRKPKQTGGTAEDTRSAFVKEVTLEAGAVPLSVPQESDPLETPPGDDPYIKVFARGGKVEFSDKLLFKPEAPDVRVEVFVERPDGEISQARYEGPPPHAAAAEQQSKEGE